MLVGGESYPRAIGVIDSVEAVKKPYQDRYVHYSHDMPDETAEASARALIRTVPMIYGVLLGGILGNMLVGLSMGAALTIALDMRMAKFSWFLPVLGPVLDPFCPVINGIAHGLAKLLRVIGLPAPAFLADMQCGIPKR